MYYPSKGARHVELVPKCSQNTTDPEWPIAAAFQRAQVARLATPGAQPGNLMGKGFAGFGDRRHAEGSEDRQSSFEAEITALPGVVTRRWRPEGGQNWQHCTRGRHRLRATK